MGADRELVAKGRRPAYRLRINIDSHPRQKCYLPLQRFNEYLLGQLKVTVLDGRMFKLGAIYCPKLHQQTLIFAVVDCSVW